MAKIVIIGAGLTGISTAYHLEQKGFHDYALFEKESIIGGLCSTVQQDGFTFDYTGHYLHASDTYFQSMIENLVGMEHLNIIDRKSFIYSHDTYTNYPFQMNLYGLPIDVIAECIEGFIKRNMFQKKTHTFPQWVMQHFGAGFATHFFFPFQQKIFGYNIKKITSSWTGRFVPSTSLKQIIQGSLTPYNQTSIGYNAHFLYPKQGGILYWVQKIANTLLNPIHTNFCVTSIDMQEKMVKFTNGHVEPYTTLISTMPLNILLKSIQEKPSITLKTAEKKLLCNSVINFNLGVNRETLSEKHWIYFPETRFPFYRLGFPSNCATSMAPSGCSSLYGEFSHVYKSKVWVQQTLHDSLKATKQLFNIADDEIVTQKIIPINHAYVIYDAWREKNLPKLHAKLKEESIHSIGRYGEWKYSSMQEAVLDGRQIVNTLLGTPTISSKKMPFIMPNKNKNVQILQ